MNSTGRKLISTLLTVSMAVSGVFAFPGAVSAGSASGKYEFTSGMEDDIQESNTQDTVDTTPSEDVFPVGQDDAVFSDSFAETNADTEMAPDRNNNSVFVVMDEEEEKVSEDNDSKNEQEDTESFADFDTAVQKGDTELLTDGSAAEETEAYDLQLMTSNTTFESAVKIGVNSTYKDKSVTNSDINLYQFTIAKDGYISISFGKEYESNKNLYWDITLYNASQEEIMERRVECGTASTEKFCKVGVPAGTYYIKVVPGYYYWSSVIYSLKVNYIPSSLWETEFNDSVDTADTLAAGKTYYASSCEKNDVDYYKVSVVRDGCISISFGKEYESNKNLYWDITLYNASQEEIMDRRVECGTAATEKFCKVGVPAGAYYIKVVPGYYYWSSVTYSLKVDQTSSSVWETEFNNSVETADAITAGKTYYGSSCEKDDVDYYKVSVSKNGYLGISFGKEYRNNTSLYWDVTLYNSLQEELMTRRVYCGTQTTDNFCRVGVPAGTYYIKVAPGYYYWSDVTYSLKLRQASSNVWETEFNDSTDTADPVNIGTAYYGNSREKNDIDYYTVNLSGTGYLSLSFSKAYDSNTSRRWNVTVFNSSQEKIMEHTFYCGNTKTEITNKIKISAGKYYIKIAPEYYYWSDVTYGFRVNISLAAPTINSVANISSGIRIKWGKVSNAAGYYIYRKTGNGAWTKIKTITNGSTVSYTDTSTKNKNGTTYYYKIYAYNGKTKSAASSYKKIVRKTTASSYDLAVNAYNAKLKSLSSAYTIMYDIVDVDGNGVPELLISSPYGWNYVYTYDTDKNNMILLKEYGMGKASGCGVTYNTSKKMFTVFTANTGGSTRIFYKLNGKTISEAATYEYQNGKFTDGPKYFVNGENCSEYTFNQKLETAQKGFQSLRYKKNS